MVQGVAKIESDRLRSSKINEFLPGFNFRHYILQYDDYQLITNPPLH